MLFIACKKQENRLFVRLPASTTNISFSNVLNATPELNILNYLYYYNGAGVAAGDFNNDDRIDLYFTSNQKEDKLFLNRGGFVFQDVTDSALIKNSTGWTTGVTHVDINNDGLLDLYICKVNNSTNLKGTNLLYLNTGNNALGIPQFKEAAADYGLDFEGFSTKAAFFDYDLDGDLDMYLLNHSINPSRTYGKGSKRNTEDARAGDRLFKNDAGYFIDVSAVSGIFQGAIGYGLDLTISDVNSDGYPDIYVGNDFFENDYLYINQKNGTFKDIISANSVQMGHTSHFSMGNDIADINNDGLTDIVSLDMLPEDLETYKTSGLEYPYPIYEQYLKNGYAPQFMQNTLHLNLGDGNFSEVAELSNIPATEWSWGALLADFDNDGLKDLFVSNGIKGATNDMDFISFIANDKIQKQLSKGMTEKEMAFVKEIPEKKVANYFFKNSDGTSFIDVTEQWHEKSPSFSNGSVYADLDNDGDLDIVVNNVDEPAFVLKNNSELHNGNNAIQIRLIGNKENVQGIGAKIFIYTKEKVQVLENYPARSYLSTVSNQLLFGIGKDSILDSLKIHWPSGRKQKLVNVPTDHPLELSFSDATLDTLPKIPPNYTLKLVQQNVPFSFVHKDNNSIEFDRDPLIPFANTNEGPGISVADVNGNGLQDVFIHGAKSQASALFLQNERGEFDKVQQELFEKDAYNEDVASIFFDADKDGFPDLLVVSAGNEFKGSEKLWPRLYRNQKGNFEKDTTQFKNLPINASQVIAVDYDNDLDLDIFITSDQVPWEFGKSPKQYLFENDGSGNFTDVTLSVAPDLNKLGNVTDISCMDVNQDGLMDIVAVGHWMPISILIHDGKSLKLQKNRSLEKTHGWWNTVKVVDFDKDGDLDIVAGNWGLNSKFQASVKEPITLYSADFDNNGSIEPLVTYFHNHQETPFASKDELTKQMPGLNKKFLSYKAFANQGVIDLFGSKTLEAAYKKSVYELASCYFINDGTGSFKKRILPFNSQVSTVNDLWVEDFDKDGYEDILAVGNDYQISTQLGRMDASHGVFLRFDKKNTFESPTDWKVNVPGPARKIEKITIASQPFYIVGINDGAPIFLSKKEQ